MTDEKREYRERDPLLYAVDVPEAERPRYWDVAERYEVRGSPAAVGGCIIWGRFHGRWHVNYSARWLVRHLLDTRKEQTP